MSSAGWYPYLSKLAFLLDTVNNLPRLRISSSLMKVILWLLQEIGVAKVPSFHHLRKIQKQIKEEGIVPTIQWMSPKGNAYSFNDPRAIIANVSGLNLNISCDLHIKGLVESLCCKAHPMVPGSSKGWCYLRNLAWNEVAPQHGLPPSKSNVQRWGWAALLHWRTSEAVRWSACHFHTLVREWRRTSLVWRMGGEGTWSTIQTINKTNPN